MVELNLPIIAARTKLLSKFQVKVLTSTAPDLYFFPFIAGLGGGEGPYKRCLFTQVYVFP